MKSQPRVGTTGELSFVVQQPHVIDITGDPQYAVLSTPWLIWFLEQAARNALADVLEPGENSVGTHIEVQHLAATPLAHTVTCRARVIHAEGKSVSFQLEAHDQQETVARGLHKRHIVQTDRFQERVKRKIPAPNA